MGEYLPSYQDRPCGYKHLWASDRTRGGPNVDLTHELVFIVHLSEIQCEQKYTAGVNITKTELNDRRANNRAR